MIFFFTLTFASKVLSAIQKVSGYDQEKIQSHTADQLTSP